MVVRVSSPRALPDGSRTTPAREEIRNAVEKLATKVAVVGFTPPYRRGYGGAARPPSVLSRYRARAEIRQWLERGLAGQEPAVARPGTPSPWAGLPRTGRTIMIGLRCSPRCRRNAKRLRANTFDWTQAESLGGEPVGWPLGPFHMLYDFVRRDEGDAKDFAKLCKECGRSGHSFYRLHEAGSRRARAWTGLWTNWRRRG